MGMPNSVLTHGRLSIDNNFHIPSWITIAFEGWIQGWFSLFFQTVLLDVDLKKLKFSLFQSTPNRILKTGKFQFSNNGKYSVLTFWLHNKWRKQWYFEVHMTSIIKWNKCVVYTLKNQTNKTLSMFTSSILNQLSTSVISNRTGMYVQPTYL